MDQLNEKLKINLDKVKQHNEREETSIRKSQKVNKVIIDKEEIKESPAFGNE